MVDPVPVQAVQNFDSSPLLANEFALTHDPLHFLLDFKSVVSQFSPGANEQVVVVTHKVVLLEPFHAKQLIEYLSTQVASYEKNFGTITKSAAVEKAEAMMTNAPVAATERPNYLG